MSPDNQIMIAISEQYGAALKMLEDTIVECDEGLWQDSNRDTVISQVIYHTLFFVDFYLSKNEDEREIFKGKYGDDGQSFHEPNKIFTKDQLTTYLQEIKEKADKRFNDLTIQMLNDESVFEWHGSSVLSSLLYNLRHIMLHVGALHVRLNAVGQQALRWVNKFPEDEGERLNSLGFNYIQSGNLTEAEKIYVKLSTDSENPLFYYNLACCYSLQGKLEQSIETLTTCLKFDRKGRFKKLAKTDNDFSNLRETPEFERLITT